MTKRKLALATPHSAATDAGRAVFAEGGNAIDSAIAACASLAVVYPHMCTIGGDLFALAYRPGAGALGFNASGAAPRARTAEDLRRRYGEMPIVGPDAVTVPGMLGGWQSLHAWGGRLPWSAVLEPAIKLAEDGCEVSPSLAASLDEVAELARDDEGMSGLFFQDGRPVSEGHLLVQRALAGTLKVIAQDGTDAFYNGELGSSYVRGLSRLGCALSREDLALHETRTVPPIFTDFRGWQVLTVPPNSQGYTLLQTLCALRQLALDPDPLSSDASVMARIFVQVARERDLVLADPSRMTVSIEELLSDEHIATLVDSLSSSPHPRGSTSGVAPQDARRSSKTAPSGDTIAVVAADGDGVGVSIIQSVYYAFGACLLEPDTGIIAQNRGSCFTLDPQSPNLFTGGVRSLHTLMPVLVTRKGRLRIIAGTMGGKAQFQIHSQILSRLLCDRVGLQDALSAPRWIVGHPDAGGPTEVAYCEEGAMSLAGPALRETGMDVQPLPDLDERVGHAQYVEIDYKSSMTAASDPRSDGSAVVV